MVKAQVEKERRLIMAKMRRRLGVPKSRQKNGPRGYNVQFRVPFDIQSFSFSNSSSSVEDGESQSPILMNEQNQVPCYDDDEIPGADESYITTQSQISEDENEEDIGRMKLTELSEEEFRPLYNLCKLDDKSGSAVIMAFMLRFNLPFQALTPLVYTINAFLPTPCLTNTKFKFYKKFEEQMSNIIKHHFCHECKSYLGTRVHGSICCFSCKSQIVTSIMYYARVPIKSQLETFFSSTTWYTHIRQLQHQEQQGKMTDLVHGENYIKLKQKIRDPFITITVCADGVQVLKANKSSMWPVQFIINELPPEVRFRLIFLAGIWYGDEKFPMNDILKILVEELNELSEKGINFLYDGQIINVKIIVLSFIADSAAKYKLQGLSQYNSKYGCTFCYYETTKVNNSVVFCRHNNNNNNDNNNNADDDDDDIQIRTHEEYLIDLNNFMIHGRSHASRGISSVSPLVLLNHFKFTEDCTVDQLHAIYLGVVKRITMLWMSSENRRKPYYIGDKLKLINERLRKIKHPSFISRRPRKIESISNWKANELRNWLLYYAVPVLHGILPHLYLTHFAQLSSSIHILLSQEISQECLVEVEEKLKHFVHNYEVIYGASSMVYNVHLMLHICPAVRKFGPLWAISMFPFETYNRVVSNFVVGARHSQLQVMNKYILLQWLTASIHTLTPYTQETIKRILEKYPYAKKLMSGKENVQAIQNSTKIEVEIHVNEGMYILTKEYKKITINSIVLSSVEYDCKFQTNNHVILLKNRQFAKVQRICCTSESRFFLLVNIHNSQDYYIGNYNAKYLGILQNTDDTRWIAMTEVQCVCVSMNFGLREFVSVPPNTIEMD